MSKSNFDELIERASIEEDYDIELDTKKWKFLNKWFDNAMKEFNLKTM